LRRLTTLALFGVLLCAAGCPRRATTLPAPPTDPQSAIEQAIGHLDSAKYKRAQEEFTFIIFNFPGSRQASDAQYYLAESYLRSKDYVQAQTELDFYLKSFPNGQFQEEASYKLALAYLKSAPGYARDQSRTIRARELVEDFLAAYPDSKLRPDAEQLRSDIDHKLALKEFDAARIYCRSGEYKSALVYYEYILDNYPAAQWPGDDRLALGDCYVQSGSPDKARPVYEGIAAGDYDGRVIQLAKDRLARLP
jgi:outer membrane protein assembly factor BamD